MRIEAHPVLGTRESGCRPPLHEVSGNREGDRFPGEANPRLTSVRGQALDLGRRAGILRLRGSSRGGTPQVSARIHGANAIVIGCPAAYCIVFVLGGTGWQGLRRKCLVRAGMKESSFHKVSGEIRFG